MLTQIPLLRNVGRFDSTTSNAQLLRLMLLYAENGRGKSTLAAIFRSASTNNPTVIAERHRLGAASTPHIVLNTATAPSPVIFQNGAWSRPVPEIAVFDDVFVDENVCSGLLVESEHRQNLHELILGAQGVVLLRNVQRFSDDVETHTKQLRTKGDAIPAEARGGLTAEKFCGLQQQSNIDDLVLAAQRALDAAKAEATIRNAATFQPLALPPMDTAVLDTLLARDLPDLDRAAAERVKAHVATLGDNGEAWVSEGLEMIPDGAHDVAGKPCPFCAQDLEGSGLIGHYQAYFGEAYAGLKGEVSAAIDALDATHDGDAIGTFERNVSAAIQSQQFWSRFTDVQPVGLATDEIAAAWSTAREAVRLELSAKRDAPLERKTLSEAARAAITAYEEKRTQVTTLNDVLQAANTAIATVKAGVAGANITELETDLASLKATKARYEPSNVTLCDDYLAEKAAKTLSEGQRDAARTALNAYRTTVFPAYQGRINHYLSQFGAGFQLDSVTSQAIKGGSAATYNVVVNNTPVAVAGGKVAAGVPSFRTVLSAGDRNTLALAFFFASLDQDPNLAGKIVIVDDPVSSLDEHRAFTTVQELRRFAQQAAQVVIMSHSKPFLCSVWEETDALPRVALQLVRSGDASLVDVWDVSRDMITAHDRRHELLRGYVQSATPNNRQVAEALRPTLEAFLRVAYPATFPPGTMLGPFRGRCEQVVGTANQILDQADIDELRGLTTYANLFHHDTNPTWQTEHINDTQLLGFVRRVLAFTQR